MRGGLPSRSSSRSASSGPPGPPEAPSPQLSQRLTAPRRPGRGGTHPKSGSPQAGHGGFSGPDPASSGTTGVCCVPGIACSVRAVQGKAEILEWESRWAKPAALVTLVAVGLLVASVFVGGAVSGDGEAEVLRSTHEHSSAVTATSLLQAFGFALFALPLFFLFRAAQARSDRVRRQFIGLILVAPLFLAISSGLSAAARNDAASTFVAGDAKPTLTRAEAKEKCVDERDELGAEDFTAEYEPEAGEAPLAACEDRQREDDAAIEARTEASTAAAVSGFGIAGALGLAVALFYTGLWAMRTGLMGRFWASLGMALGIAIIFGLFPLALIWFLYLALLIAGWLPGGKPPAWDAGEAIPWPTPGEKAAEELEPEDPDNGEESSADQALGEERRKRKQRD